MRENEVGSDPAENPEARTPREAFAGKGFSPLPPTQLNDRQLPGRLWELLYAAAALGFFFQFTNHLSDRELYTLLWGWLDKPVDSDTLEAEMEVVFPLSRFNAQGQPDDDVWLRYYAGEEDRASLGPNRVLPPHEAPPHDRDRFLPGAPPVPGGPQEDWLSEDADEEDEPDPLGLASVDREIAASRTGASPEAGQRVHDPVPLARPAEISDEMLPSILWELLHNLSLRGFCVLHTDHLSDREVYSALCDLGFRNPADLPGRPDGGGTFHDFLGGWGPKEVQLWLRYYADEFEREDHESEYPDDEIPPQEEPPFKRDWRLPQSEG